jgi:5-(carboxyamino)imidazole ribonucleotide mutase
MDSSESMPSIVQMPAGVPVATVSIGGARNAGLLAVRILGVGDPALQERMRAFQVALGDAARAKDVALQERLRG